MKEPVLMTLYLYALCKVTYITRNGFNLMTFYLTYALLSHITRNELFSSKSHTSTVYRCSVTGVVGRNSNTLCKYLATFACLLLTE